MIEISISTLLGMLNLKVILRMSYSISLAINQNFLILNFWVMHE